MKKKLKKVLKKECNHKFLVVKSHTQSSDINPSITGTTVPPFLVEIVILVCEKCGEGRKIIIQ